jgi:hypothetical protein
VTGYKALVLVWMVGYRFSPSSSSSQVIFVY